MQWILLFLDVLFSLRGTSSQCRFVRVFERQCQMALLQAQASVQCGLSLERLAFLRLFPAGHNAQVSRGFGAIVPFSSIERVLLVVWPANCYPVAFHTSCFIRRESGRPMPVPVNEPLIFAVAVFVQLLGISSVALARVSERSTAQALCQTYRRVRSAP